MASIRVLGQDANEFVTQRVVSKGAKVESYTEDGDEVAIFEPAVAQRVEYDHSGQTSSVTTVCGETENRRQGDDNPDITIEGIITNSQIPEIKSLKEGEEIQLQSDIHSGKTLIKRVTIEQRSDLHQYIPDNGEPELAFGFQLQLGQPE